MGKVPEYTKRAIEKYQKEKTVHLAISLHPERDADIIAQMEQQTNKQGYIKALIREDIHGQGKT